MGAGAGSGSDAGGIYAVGGKGGGESDGAEVTVNNSGTIETRNDDSYAVFAQSIGGGGGDGGGAGGWFTVGGQGGSGGNSDVVTVVDSGTVMTSGDRSTAIFAQSIGGGGGNGGDAVSISPALSVAVGGDGALGGDGDNVHVLADGSDIDTSGDDSHGIHAQSIGGGGGNGGLAITGALPANMGMQLSIALGGDGAGGGDAGDLVEVITTSDTTIDTSGNNSYGIVAQSIGGGGGNGGAAIAGAGGAGLNLSVAIGGAGAGGGHGGDVLVDNGGTITTSGDSSIGIAAQSIGGGGGNGGLAGSVSVGAISAGVSLGGGGGAGGLAVQVDVINQGALMTLGDNAIGIFAQSVGGGGGNGGSAISGTGGIVSVATSVGGAGGAGNDGGIVNVFNQGLIATYGDNAAGVFAQSVGGGGGNGGSATSGAIAGGAAIAVGVGGSGGEGGDGKDVNVDNEGTIYTEGTNSDGVFAQSIGGSGGAGGSATTATLAFPVEIEEVEIPAINVNVAVGGRGGGGGQAGVVDISNSGTIITSGFMANGIFAQSVGGSGGRGGNANNIQIAFDALFSGTVGVGGSGGLGGIGNTVTIDNSGAIWTKGDWSNGVFAQSVGGGGGFGGDATTVALSLTPPPTSPEDFIPTPDMSFDLAIGGDGGEGAIGGYVEVGNTGTVITEGDFSVGVMAQSIGGAGGAGGDATVIQVDLSADPMDFISLLDLMSLDVTLVFGGTGGDGGNGGDVVVTNEGGIKTSGAFSHGIVAQSVGGGGGSGGSAATFEFSNTDLPVDIPVLDDIAGLTTIEMTFQGSGGAGGDGGDVTLNSNGVVLTEGEFAMGVVGQSVAGGGGLAGFFNPHGIINNEVGDAIFNALIDTDAGFSFAGSVGGAGDAGNVIINHAGNIQTLGTGAHGIFGQSAAGQGEAGTVDITLDGSVWTLGEHSYGVFAHSGGASGNGDITVTLGGGTVMGGSGQGAGLMVAGGGDNSVFNSGTITSVGGLGGYAIRSLGGGEYVENNGMMIGSVDLGGGQNHILNYGLINAGIFYNLGAGNLLLNEGDFAAGGISNPFVTQVTGDFTQSDLGTLWFDVVFDFGIDAWDYLNISGVSSFDGTLKLLLHDTGKVMPGKWQTTLISSGSGISNFGLDLDVPDSAVINYALKAASETDYMLHYIVDFAATGLSRNQSAMGEHFNDIQLAGSTEMMMPLTEAIVALPDVPTLGSAYDVLSPHIYSANQLSRLFSALDFENSLHSCPVRDGDLRFSREGDCTWIRVSGRDMQYEGRHGLPAASDYATIINFGLQRALSQHWHGGIGCGFERSEYEIRDLADRDGTQTQLGGILKGRYGRNAYDLSLTMGRGQFDTDRYTMNAYNGSYVTGDRDIRFVSAHAGYAYSFERENWFVRPGLDIGWTDVNGDRIDEANGGPTALQVKGTDDAYVTSSLDVRLGGEISTRNDVRYRPFLRTAYTHIHSGTRNEIDARLAGAPDSVPDFTQVLFVDDNYTSVSLGLDILARQNWVMSFTYDRQFADRWDADSFFAKIMFEM
ncbi:MAG: autotransporter outer membrane beta-barrel domain-containing protein [Woeseiaceae bacterium]